MKNLRWIPAVCCLLLSACTKNITSLNTDPKSAKSAPAAALFLQAEKNFSDAYSSTSVSSAPFRVLAQEWTENTYVYEAQYNFSAYQAPDGWWSNLYSQVLNNLEQAKLAFPTYVTGQPVTLNNDLIITDILEVYTYHLLMATYGNVPYSEAEKDSVPFPKYDDAKTIYSDLLHRLDTCIADIDVSGDAMGDADQIYGGDPAAWKAFAATLELKLALLSADVDLPSATKSVQAAVAAGVFKSNADNALFAYDKSTSSNSNPIWQALIQSGRHDFCPAGFLISTMSGLHDPRLPLLFTQYPKGSGKYQGGKAGGGNGYGSTSDFAASMLTPDYPGDLLDYPETEFLLAEAAARGINVGGSAASHYDKAITASIEFWGGTAAQAAAYLLQPKINYATATGNWRQKIGYQAWIAYYNRNWDAWTSIRRLGYPDINKVSPPIGAQSVFPLRFPYPANEQSSNPVNWKDGVAALPGGKDVVSAKLWWMP